MTQKNGERVRVAVMSDLHCRRTSIGTFKPLFLQAAERAEVLLLCGDLTDYGLPEEARIFAEEIADAVKRIPVVSVLGNHDLESGEETEVRRILMDAGLTLLDGNSTQVCGIGFAGVKGFAGGFGKRALQPWGEAVIKAFVKESADEAARLDAALEQLKTPHRIALLHYSPIRDTVEGEALEIFPFLGSSVLEEPLNRHRVTAVFHGHAHKGCPEGRTSGRIPVYNVAMHVLRSAFPHEAPFRLFALSTASGESAPLVPLGRAEA